MACSNGPYNSYYWNTKGDMIIRSYFQSTEYMWNGSATSLPPPLPLQRYSTVPKFHGHNKKHIFPLKSGFQQKYNLFHCCSSLHQFDNLQETVALLLELFPSILLSLLFSVFFLHFVTKFTLPSLYSQLTACMHKCIHPHTLMHTRGER